MTCSVESCDRDQVVRGWCRMHYQRWRDHGDPNRERPSALHRVLSRTVRVGACEEWQGPRDKDGYGVVKVAGRMVRTHRAVWEQTYGLIPARLSVLHSCDNPPCVRPDHLMLGTQRANIQDMLAKGRRPRRKAA